MLSSLRASRDESVTYGLTRIVRVGESVEIPVPSRVLKEVDERRALGVWVVDEYGTRSFGRVWLRRFSPDVQERVGATSPLKAKT